MSVHANFHRVTAWSVGATTKHGGTKDCPHTFYSTQVVIEADGVRHEFNLFADDAEALARKEPK